jgi:hypothetical protein
MGKKYNGAGTLLTDNSSNLCKGYNITLPHDRDSDCMCICMSTLYHHIILKWYIPVQHSRSFIAPFPFSDKPMTATERVFHTKRTITEEFLCPYKDLKIGAQHTEFSVGLSHLMFVDKVSWDQLI